MAAQQQEPYSTRPSIDILNDDILMRIFDFLHFDDKIRLRRACSRWRMLLDQQVSRAKSLRMGQFQQGGYSVTSGLSMQCHHCLSNHRQHTGTLFNGHVFSLPADLETQCFSINRFDYLHRALKYCSDSITTLSLGRLKISYRLLIVLTHNLPHLEHLELIACASDFPRQKRRLSPHGMTYNQANGGARMEAAAALPSLESFNTQQLQQLQDETYSMFLYNQHHDEQVNMEQRLARSAMVKKCELVRESKEHWPNMRHLLIKECHLLNEFSLSLILATTSKSLNQLIVESNQYLTGEFLNYCGPQLQILKVKHCPLFQVKFLEDLVKMRQLLATTPTKTSQASSENEKTEDQPLYPRPINNSMLRNFRNSNQAIYCTL